jgi:glycosyltransferase involved in cell wall biosynthesis
MPKPKVSIIFPFYNCEKFIEQSLSSFRYLSSSDFEIIAINDGSTDDSLKVAKKALCGFTIDWSLINRTVNQGCFKARMKAIEASRGKYIAIADSDDVNCNRRFERQLDFLENNKEIWGCGGWATKITQKGCYIETMDYPPYNNELIIKKIVSDPTSNPIIDPTTMFRKSDFYDLGGYSFSEDRNLVADMDLWFRSLLSDKKFVNIPIELIQYRVNLNSNTNRYQKEMIKQHVAVRREFIRDLKRI